MNFIGRARDVNRSRKPDSNNFYNRNFVIKEYSGIREESMQAGRSIISQLIPTDLSCIDWRAIVRRYHWYLRTACTTGNLEFAT